MRVEVSLTLDSGIAMRLEEEAYKMNKSVSRHVEDVLVEAGYEKRR